MAVGQDRTREKSNLNLLRQSRIRYFRCVAFSSDFLPGDLRLSAGGKWMANTSSDRSAQHAALPPSRLPSPPPHSKPFRHRCAYDAHSRPRLHLPHTQSLKQVESGSVTESDKTAFWSLLKLYNKSQGRLTPHSDKKLR